MMRFSGSRILHSRSWCRSATAAAACPNHGQPSTARTDSRHTCNSHLLTSGAYPIYHESTEGERAMTNHKTGTRQEWLRARLELLDAEKELTRRSDELAERRQALPWVRVDKEYL